MQLGGVTGSALVDCMIRFQGKMWGDPSTLDCEQEMHPLTLEEAARVPMNNERMCVTTYDNNTQELMVDMDSTYLSERFRRCRRVWYKQVVDPSVAIPFLMGGNLRLGADSPVLSLNSDMLCLIVQRTIPQWTSSLSLTYMIKQAI